MLVLMLMSMLMSYASVDFFVLSFVLSCAYAYVTSEDQALQVPLLSGSSTWVAVFFIQFPWELNF